MTTFHTSLLLIEVAVALWAFDAKAEEPAKWLPKTNAPHFRGSESARSETRQEFRQSSSSLRDEKNTLHGSESRATLGATAPTITSKVLTTFATEAAQKRPNVIILLADDLGSKDLGCYGGPVKTPVLDELAAKGVRFTDFHAGAAICSPSRATLITGRQHLRTGIYGVLQDQWHDMHLLEREVTIPELLQQEGYGTAHFGKWHIGMTSGKRKKPSPTDHGFDYWFGLSNGAHPSHKDPVNFLRNGERVGPLKGYSCQLIVDDAIRWLNEKKNPAEPFFLNLWFNEPHHKLAAPDEIVSLYGDLKDEAAIYSATIDNTDRAIGRLVEKLKVMGKLDNTLIIYSSDHGSYRADRNGGLTGNKGSNFQGGLRSPGIFFWPNGFRGGRIEETPSGSVDLLPTICGLIGIDKPKDVHLDGADLSPLLTEKGTFKRDQPLLWLAPSSGHLATLRDGDYTLMGYRGYQLPFPRERYNEVVRKMAEVSGIDPSLPNLGQRVSNTTFANPEFNRLNLERVRLQTFQEAWIPTIKAGGFSRFALYDLSTDPLQKKDISKERSEVTERLKMKLLKLYKDVMADAPDWAPSESRAGSHRPNALTRPVGTGPTPSSPRLSAEDKELSDLLTRIEQTEFPDGYNVSNHQPWVDRRMESLKPEQRRRIGGLWKEKRRLQPQMKNAGMSFVRILEFVAGGEKDPGGETSMEAKTRIHRLNTTKRSAFDAFAYVNRIPIEPETGEDQANLASRIESRLANQEGRVQIKLPPTMNRDAYEGFKLAAGIGWPQSSATLPPGESEPKRRVGNGAENTNLQSSRAASNCFSCHHLPALGSNRRDMEVPTLRNRTYTRDQFRAKLESKAHEHIPATDNVANRLHAFLQSLNDVPDAEFRPLILNATVLDTTGDIE